MRIMARSIFFLVAVLCLSAAPVRAGWTAAGSDDFSKIYFDPASRHGNDDGSVSVRALTDYDPASPQAEGFGLSEKGLSEIEKVLFDCAKTAYRSDGGVWYEDHMAMGAVRRQYPPRTAWSKVPSFYVKLFEKVCETR
jgi:hypothetical protein